jgi:wyosine [tRNA(Phe)-imidazoG37] synthetase (radical SAM superfamily)
MNYVFGPVPSRRLGQSLGIDPIPLKTCNWNCVYCQLGRSIPLMNERREYFPREDIIAEVEQALASHAQGEIDWVTFVGSGETTLHTSMGRLIRQVKSLTHLPVAVITNGSLLYLPEIRLELSPADAVLPSLDAGNARLYRKINRPHPEVSFNRLIEGLIAFRKEYQGKLWVEVMLVKDINDTVEALQEIALALEKIQPDQVHLLLPMRPPAESWVQPSDINGIQRAKDILGSVTPVETPASVPRDATTPVLTKDDLELAILGIVQRHPMQENELHIALGKWSLDEVHNALEILLATGKVQIIERYKQCFWSSAESIYKK